MNGTTDGRFAPLVARFGRLFRRPEQGGGALAVYVDGEPVVDVWSGYADNRGERRWEHDTMALSFSTSKGAASTVIHRLVEQGALAYDQPIATWWPAFAANGKQHITLRELLSHRAGLHKARGLLQHPEQLLDHRAAAEALARGRPTLPPGGPPAYHALTYGWLVAAIVEHATGKEFPQVLHDVLSKPLDLDGCYIRVPQDQRHRVAELFPGILPGGMSVEALGRRLDGRRQFRQFTHALVIDGLDEVIMKASILDAVMPAANGVFTARSLAKMYGALANQGEVEGTRFLEADTVRELGRVQTRQRDRVIGIPMRWRLGYHRAFTARPRAPKAFGHFGYGGSGAWADPETRMSIAFVTNRLGNATTPVGDARLVRFGGLALKLMRVTD